MGRVRVIGCGLCAILLLIMVVPSASAVPTIVDFGECEINIQNNNVIAYVEIDDEIVIDGVYTYDLSDHQNEPLYITIDTLLDDQTGQNLQYKYYFRMATHWDYNGQGGDGGSDQINNSQYPGWDWTPIQGSPISDELLVDYAGLPGLVVTVFITAEVWENTNPPHHDSDGAVFEIDFVA